MRAGVFLVLCACGGGGSGGPIDGTSGSEASRLFDAPPGHTHYVLSTIDVPTTPEEANALGFDLDGVGQVHNAFGSVIASLTDPNGLDPHAGTTAAVTSGAIVQLALLTHDDPSAASWRAFLGAPTATPPDLSGGGTFTVASAMDGSLDGAITAGHLSAQVPAGSTATLPVQLVMYQGGDPFTLQLVGGHVEADVTASGCTNGKLGGGVTQDDLDNQFTPAFAVAADARINSAACRTGAASGDYSSCDSASRALLQIFDKTPRDGTISLAEVQNNTFYQTLLGLDVDLLDDSGGYNPTPSSSGSAVADSLSFGIGFTCADATFNE